MSVSAELLDKYFKGQCTPEEKLLVGKYLSETEDLPAHLLPENEWDQTQDAVLTEVKTQEIFHAIQQQIKPEHKRVKWLKIMAAAAAVLAVLTAGLLTMKNELPKQKSTQNASLVQKKTNPVNWKSVVNYTEQNQSLMLPDHSTVKIYPGGELRYTLPFINEKREIYLKGKSFFQVAKDKKHPFVVYANGISTTALGTSFTITAFEKSKLIKVQLHTGKVWIKNIDSVHQILPFNKILMPGNELVYNRRVNSVKVSETHQLLPVRPEIKPAELNFTQAPLVDVFARLEKQYQVKISYNPDDLQEMSFTGSLKLTQSIDTILEEIAELNKLTQTKTTTGYLISK